MKPRSEEALWSGEFGNSYIQRNQKLPDRRKFWKQFIRERDIHGNILEVGCNIGFNLIPLSEIRANLWGVDINSRAIKIIHSTHPEISVGWATIFDLPFRDRWFDLVFTVGLLIHIHPNNLEDAVNQLWRVTFGNLLVCEYEAPEWMEIPYHGKRKALFKGPYGKYISEVIGQMPAENGLLSPDEGFDHVTWWRWER